ADRYSNGRVRDYFQVNEPKEHYYEIDPSSSKLRPRRFEVIRGGFKNKNIAVPFSWRPGSCWSNGGRDWIDEIAHKPSIRTSRHIARNRTPQSAASTGLVDGICLVIYIVCDTLRPRCVSPGRWGSTIGSPGRTNSEFRPRNPIRLSARVIFAAKDVRDGATNSSTATAAGRPANLHSGISSHRGSQTESRRGGRRCLPVSRSRPDSR